MTNPPYTPTINLGFLYDTKDHQVELTRPEHGIDLMLRIEADPKNNPDCRRIIHELKEGRQRILQKETEQGQIYRTRVRLRDEPGSGIKWSLLIAQKCLADVIENCDSEEKQLQAIYEYFRQLLTSLFSDPQLEQELRELNPYRGDISPKEGSPGNCWPYRF